MKPRTAQEIREGEVRKQADLIRLRIASAIPKFSRQVLRERRLMTDRIDLEDVDHALALPAIRALPKALGWLP